MPYFTHTSHSTRPSKMKNIFSKGMLFVVLVSFFTGCQVTKEDQVKPTASRELKSITYSESATQPAPAIAKPKSGVPTSNLLACNLTATDICFHYGDGGVSCHTIYLFRCYNGPEGSGPGNTYIPDHSDDIRTRSAEGSINWTINFQGGSPVEILATQQGSNNGRTFEYLGSYIGSLNPDGTFQYVSYIALTDLAGLKTVYQLTIKYDPANTANFAQILNTIVNP
jgi:hypothetical protein